MIYFRTRPIPWIGDLLQFFPIWTTRRKQIADGQTEPSGKRSLLLIIAMNGPSSETWSMSSDGRVRLHRVQDDRNSFENLLTLPANSDQPGSHHERSPSRQHAGTHRKHRSLSSPKTTTTTTTTQSNSGRTPTSAKPKKARRYLGTASTSLTSIPNAIKLSMLNSGLLSVGEIGRLKAFSFAYVCACAYRGAPPLTSDPVRITLYGRRSGVVVGTR